MVQTSKEIMRWHNGCTFRLVFALLTSWVFWDVSGLDAIGNYQNSICWQLVTIILLFIKPHNWLLDCTSRVSFRPILLKRNGIYFVYENFGRHSSNYFYLGLLHQNGRPGDWDCNHTRLRSRTWSSEILPFQCLFSKPSSPMPGSSIGKEATWNAGDPGSISGSGRSPREGID